MAKQCHPEPQNGVFKHAFHVAEKLKLPDVFGHLWTFSGVSLRLCRSRSRITGADGDLSYCFVTSKTTLIPTFMTVFRVCNWPERKHDWGFKSSKDRQKVEAVGSHALNMQTTGLIPWYFLLSHEEIQAPKILHSLTDVVARHRLEATV